MKQITFFNWPHIEKFIIICLLFYIVRDRAFSLYRGRAFSTVLITEENKKAKEEPQRSRVTNFSQSDSSMEFGSIAKRFASRRSHLMKSCRREGILGLEKYLVEEKSLPGPNMLYLDEFKLIYCGIPKVIIIKNLRLKKILRANITYYYVDIYNGINNYYSDWIN